MPGKNLCKFVSLNVRGIRNYEKRSSIFSFLKDQEASFYFLQETFSDPSDESLWKNEWGGEIIFSHGTRHSRGVCILINPSVKKLKVVYSHCDASGRFILINLTVDCLELSLCNIYAPNNHTDQLQFIQNLNNLLIDKSELSSLIIGGDWNCTLTKKDKKGGLLWKPTIFRNSILITMDMLNLIDIQRIKHPNVDKYSYESKALKMKSRIDYFLMAKNLTKYVHKIDIQPSIAPDHKLVCLSIQWEKLSTRGPGFWKFNNNLLKDEDYIERIRKSYPEFRSKYSYVQDEQILWELLKMEIRTSTISFAKGKAQINRERELFVKDQLDELDRKICLSTDLQNVDHELKQYDNLKKELQELYEAKGEAARFRAKCLWIEKGERPTKYFFNLEKRNDNRKVISELEDEDGEIIENEKQILLEIERYYRNLYTSKINVTENQFEQYTDDVQLPQLSIEERESLEGLLTFEECKNILTTFKNDKSPGEDGFTAEFYSTFFDLIGGDLVKSLNAGYEKGKLSISQ